MDKAQKAPLLKAEAFARIAKVMPEYRPTTPNAAVVRMPELMDHGILFVDVDFKVVNTVYKELADIAIALYSSSDSFFDRTFYSNFDEVAKRSVSQVLIEQCLHYLSTYGAEMMGEPVTPYIPASELGLRLEHLNRKHVVVIRLLPELELSELADNILRSTAAPSRSLISDYKEIVKCTSLNLKIKEIKSFELQAAFCAYRHLLPQGCEEQLRLIIYILTGETLVIKNRRLVTLIISACQGYNTTLEQRTDALQLLETANIKNMASIFYRYKPLFLALKKLDGAAPTINAIRRAAPIYHNPQSFMTVKNFFSEKMDLDAAAVIEKRLTDRERIKLLSAYLAKGVASGETDQGGVRDYEAYTVRNGSIFVKKKKAKPVSPLDISKGALLFDSLVPRFERNIIGKSFYIPDAVDYAMPCSEKQMTGGIPWGSAVTALTEDSFVAGIHWVDGKSRTDLDLHMNSPFHAYGWNGSYKGEDKARIVYSGDMTSAPAPLGAAEAYLFQKVEPSKDEEFEESVFAMSVNRYCGESGETPFQFFLHKGTGFSGRGYIYNDQEALIPPIPLKMGKDVDEVHLGFFCGKTFFFQGGTLSNGRVPSKHYASFISGLLPKVLGKMSVRKVLQICGANIYGDSSFAALSDEEKKDVINLSPEMLTPTTLFTVFGIE